MIAVDTNFLVYAHREDLGRHREAKARLIELAEGDARWSIPVFCLGEFLRIMTHPKVFDPPYSPREAVDALRRVLSSPSLTILLPGPRYPQLLFEAVEEANAVGNLAFDAQIVAVLREAGVDKFQTEDRDFDRFRGLTALHIPQ